MADLKSPTAIWVKGWLFLFLGCVATALVLFNAPRLSVLALHCIAIWAFCRFYYFTFYVIERYVDDTYRFAGLAAFAQYAWRRHKSDRESIDS